MFVPIMSEWFQACVLWCGFESIGPLPDYRLKEKDSWNHERVTYLFTFSVCLSVYLSVCLSICLSVYQIVVKHPTRQASPVTSQNQQKETQSCWPAPAPPPTSPSSGFTGTPSWSRMTSSTPSPSPLPGLGHTTETTLVTSHPSTHRGHLSVWPSCCNVSVVIYVDCWDKVTYVAESKADINLCFCRQW